MQLVLDTNIYRNLVRNLNFEDIEKLIKAIKAEATKQGIKIFFPINSAMELISHFNDDNIYEKEECVNALKLLVACSTSSSSTHLHVDFVPPLNAILERYFEGSDSIYAEMYSRVIAVAQMLNKNIISDSKEVVNGYIETIKKQVRVEKEEIRNNYEEYLKSINNGTANWAYFKEKKSLRRDYFGRLKVGRLSFLVAQSIVNRAYNIVGKHITKDDDYFDVVIGFLQEFCPAFVMNERLLKNIGDSVEAIQDVDDGRWNTIIDISLIFGSLYNPNKTDRKLVTEEKNIHQSFQDCGFQNKILNLAEFKVLMNLP